MSNTSATGGYLAAGSTTPLPGGLTLNQFIQTVLVGISGLAGPMVRPELQEAPPNQPSAILTSWISFSVNINAKSFNAYQALDINGDPVFQRQEVLTISCQIYGVDALGLASLIADGFQINQNVAALKAANMGFVECGPIRTVPDLLNERYRNRAIMDIVINRQIQRVYPILPIVSASGTIHTVLGNEEYLLGFDSENNTEE